MEKDCRFHPPQNVFSDLAGKRDVKNAGVRKRGLTKPPWALCGEWLVHFKRKILIVEKV